MRILSAIVLTLAVAAGAARAGDAPPSAAQQAAAREAVEASGAIRYLNTDALETALIGQLRQDAPDLKDDTLQTIRQVFREEMTANQKNMIDELIVIYARHYSEQDLKALAAFYRTEAGKRLVEQAPAVAMESGRLVMPVMMKIMESLKKRLGEGAPAGKEEKTETK